MMKKMAVLAASAVCLLAGACSASVNFTVSPDSLADDIARMLERDGLTPDIDCGDEDIDIVNGNVVHCDLSAAGDTAVYDVTVTFSEVSGKNYHIDAQVADAPK
ncbi:MAG: DUF4333 domain-containing protein [Propionibacteriaceae bacterium]|nr:DUF4333 domain-containing protein [Propionibacteriaceae bacterium]